MGGRYGGSAGFSVCRESDFVTCKGFGGLPMCSRTMVFSECWQARFYDDAGWMLCCELRISMGLLRGVGDSGAGGREVAIFLL